MNREENLNQLKDKSKAWDIAVIGGGSSGLGVALDAVSRGLSVVLLEKADFAKGTSSRSTKLVHGGVRYLAQGDIALVLEALRERGMLLKNAPHLTQNQPFIIPIYTWWDRIQYSAGLKIYDWMAGKLRLGKSRFISKSETIKRLPAVLQKGLKGGVVYHDGQFDDARLALNIAQTADELGACMLNYMKVSGLVKNESGKISGLKVIDEQTKEKLEIQAKMVVNATGVFADKILQMDNPEAPKTIQPSQGIHLVMDLDFLGGKDGQNVKEDSYEAARLYHALKPKYSGTVDESKLSAIEKEEYRIFKKAQGDIEHGSTEAQSQVLFLRSLYNKSSIADSLLKEKFKPEYNGNDLVTFKPANSKDADAKSTMLALFRGFEMMDATNDFIIKEFSSYFKGQEKKAEASQTAPKDYRGEIVKDNYYDFNDRFYGNPDVPTHQSEWRLMPVNHARLSGQYHLRQEYCWCCRPPGSSTAPIERC